MTTAATIDPARCPLCGGDNACARVADPAATACWCREVEFPPALLEQVPAAAKNRCCICVDCAKRTAQLATAIEH